MSSPAKVSNGFHQVRSSKTEPTGESLLNRISDPKSFVPAVQPMLQQLEGEIRKHPKAAMLTGLAIGAAFALLTRRFR